MSEDLRKKKTDGINGQNMPQAGQTGALLGELTEEGAPPIGEREVQEATRTLLKYKSGKAFLERRVISSENWWKLRHWSEMPVGNRYDRKPVSAWLFNVIMGKHADAVEAYPEPNILPREEGDKAEAKMLSSIIPVVLEHSGFEEIYSDCAWQKMRQGTGIYGVFWDGSRLGGLGDIAIKKVDVLSLFWKPGITDIEDSPNLFCVDIVDNDELEARYPELKNRLRGNTLTVSRYIYDDSVDESGCSVVVDWYYKRWVNGRRILHYCKYVGDTVLYASENIPKLRDRGYYDDGEYPFVFDPLFPIEGSPCGYGYIDIGKSPQESIDQLNQAITKNAAMAASPRYFIRKDGAVNEEEFADWTKPLVHVNGNLGEDSIKQIVVSPLNDIYVAILNNKVEELKFTSGNQDVANGTVSSGVTAASAIAALQESAGRSSRAATKSAYRAYAKIITKVIERIRQFYDMPRKFRILGQRGMAEYVTYTNANLRSRSQGQLMGMDMGIRKPVFDVKVAPQKASPYSRLSQNELALQLFQLGIFNPQLTDQAANVLDMMEFDGKDGVLQKISENGSVYRQLREYQQLALTLAAKADPQMAEELAQKIDGAAGGGVPLSGGKRAKSGSFLKSAEAGTGRVDSARSQSRQASQPS